MLGNILNFENALIGLLGLLVAFVGKNYLLPLLKVERSRRFARWIALLADEITDDLVARYPDNGWVKFIDEAVDSLMEICGISQEIAGRAINSALARKGKQVAA